MWHIKHKQLYQRPVYHAWCVMVVLHDACVGLKLKQLNTAQRDHTLMHLLTIWCAWSELQQRRKPPNYTGVVATPHRVRLLLWFMARPKWLYVPKSVIFNSYVARAKKQEQSDHANCRRYVTASELQHMWATNQLISLALWTNCDQCIYVA